MAPVTEQARASGQVPFVTRGEESSQTTAFTSEIVMMCRIQGPRVWESTWTMPLRSRVTLGKVLNSLNPSFFTYEVGIAMVAVPAS